MKSSDVLPGNDRDFINRLFAQLQAIFPAWRAAFPDDAAVAEAKRQWTAGLVQNGMTDIEAIKGGLRVARRSESPFLPSVGQFVAWCRQARLETMSLPSRGEVEREISHWAHSRQFPPSHPAGVPTISPMAFWIYQNMDVYRWRREPCEKADKILDAAYSRALQVAGEGFEFPEPPVMIARQPGSPDVEITQEMRERAEKTRAELRALFKLGDGEDVH